MRTILATLITCLMPFMASAESIGWGDVNLPVRAGQWHQLSETSRSGYIIGALQAAAYLNADGEEQIGCVIDLADTLFAETSAPSFSDMVVTAVADRVLDTCGAGSFGTGTLLSSRQLAAAFTDDGGSTVWIGFLVGMTEFFHFQTYAKFGDETAECVQDGTLDLLTMEGDDFLTWSKTPDDPFVEDALLRALSGCHTD